MTQTITIRFQPPFRPLRSLFAAAVEIGIIGVGVWCDSAAMQWAGFLCLILIAINMIRSYAERNNDLTIADARKRLDEIEAGAQP